MSRGVLVTAAVVSLAWAIGLGSLAVRDRNAQADLLGEYIEDNCISQTHDLGHCILLRGDGEEASRKSFPVGNVAAVIIIPIAVLWSGVWFLRRRQQRKAALRTVN